MPPKATKKPAQSTTSKPAKKTERKPKPKSSAKAKPKAKPKATTKAVAPKAKTVTESPKVFDYESLLKRAREEIPPEVFEQPRFQVPKVDSFIQGSRTVVRNFKDLTDTLRRDPKHLLRYLSHELATAGEIRSPQVIFNGRFTSRQLEEHVTKYTNEFVVCPICHRPDTEMRREDRLLMLICSACGGRTPLKG